MYNPSQIYEEQRSENLSGRELEAAVLSRAARKLKRAAQLWDQQTSPEFREALDEALSFTQRLWTFLQVELSNPEHPMPMELRRDLLRLSIYIDQAILRLYAGGTLEELRTIARITEEVAGGLSISVPSESGDVELPESEPEVETDLRAYLNVTA